MVITAVYFANQSKTNSIAFHVQKMDRKFVINTGMESNAIFTAKLLIQVPAMKMAREHARRTGMVLIAKL